MTDQAQDKLWGGRFTEATDAFVEAFTASVTFDKKMAEQDINGSIAHATMLAAVGVLTDAEKQQMVDLKDLGAAFIAKCHEIGGSRELSLAVTNAEQAVMWAVKHVTR